MIEGPVLDSAFWIGFWPQLFATIVGVLIGVPVGLWLNRRAIAVAGVAQEKADATRLDDALASLVASIEANRGPLNAMATLATGHYLVEPGLETTTWDAVKTEIVSLLRVPDLQRSLAAHFASIDRAARLCDLLAQHSSGVQGAMSNSAQTREVIMTRLVAAASATLEQADALLKVIDEVRKGAQKK